MEYTVSQLAALSGVSPRTLRYYDEIGLLKPERVSGGGYRIYGQVQVNRLQQILFYREMDLSLENIQEILESPDFDRRQALEEHLLTLQLKKERMEALIENVSRTLRSLEGEIVMDDEQKFEGLKQKKIEENEEKYGQEVRERFGEEAMDASNAKLAGMSKAQWEEQERLSKEILEKLAEAVKTGDPAGSLAQEVCKLHRTWLCLFWKDGSCTKEAHRNMGEMYAADERFRAFYEKAAPGATEFLRDALNCYYETQ